MVHTNIMVRWIFVVLLSILANSASFVSCSIVRLLLLCVTPSLHIDYYWNYISYRVFASPCRKSKEQVLDCSHFVWP